MLLSVSVFSALILFLFYLRCTTNDKGEIIYKNKKDLRVLKLKFVVSYSVIVFFTACFVYMFSSEYVNKYLVEKDYYENTLSAMNINAKDVDGHLLDILEINKRLAEKKAKSTMFWNFYDGRLKHLDFINYNGILKLRFKRFPGPDNNGIFGELDAYKGQF